MRTWVTLSVEQDDKLVEIARQPFDVPEGEFVRRVFVVVERTQDGETRRTDLATTFELAP